MSFNNLKLGAKFALSFGVVVLIVASMAGSVFWFASGHAADDGRNGQSDVAQTSVGLARGDIFLASMRLRGFLLTGDPTAKSSAFNAEESFSTNLGKLRQLTTRNPSLKAPLDKLEVDEREWKTSVLVPEFALAEGPGGRAAAIPLLPTFHGDEKVGAVVADLADLTKQVDAWSDGDTAQANKSLHTMQTVVAVAAVIAALMSAVLGWLMTRVVAKPVSEMTEAMLALASGDHDVEIPGVGRKDEIGDMAGAVQSFKDAAIANVRLEEAGKQGQIELKAMMTAIDRAQARIEFDLNGTVLDANANFLSALGYTAEEVIGRKHAMFVEESYARSSDYQHFWQRLNAGEFIAEKFKRIGKNGRVVWIQASYNPLIGQDGKPFKVVKFATDVTAIEDERKASEARREAQSAEQATVVRALATGLGEVSDGNLMSRISETFPAEYEQLRTDFNAAITSLAETLAQVRAGTEGIRTGTDEIAIASDDLSRRTEQQAASLEETAAALDEITATVRKTASGSKQASDTTTKTKAEAVRSGEVVAQAVEAMGLIESSAQQISQIIGVIDEIAFQTNLLALNAGVEAARAGDAGKGFAVVASEVRALAQRSAEAAKEIKALISTSSRQVGEGVNLVGETGKALKQISVQVGEIDVLVSEIAASAQEQATALAEVNTAVNQMDQVVQQNAAMVEQSTAATHSLKAETAEVARLIARFKTGAGESTGRSAPQAATARNQPAPSPARALTRRLAETVGATALKSADGGWEEF